MKFGIQNRDNKLVLNMLFRIDDFVPHFGPAIEVLSDFMKFGTRNEEREDRNLPPTYFCELLP